MTIRDLADSRLITELPPHLRERSRCLAERSVNSAGDFVLYWMHHAVRGHDNPALDLALTLAWRLGLPVLVYQGLGGVPYDNDRHHTCILQGARDAQRELRKRGISAVFHLERRGERPSPLHRMARRAALLVVEDYPAPPFRARTQRLAKCASGPVIAVDCCCLVPMQTLPSRFDRVSDFRRATAVKFAACAARAWPRTEATATPFDGGLDFVPLDLQQTDIAAVCAECTIDHSVPPVAHTPGGSHAGYAVWRALRDQALRAYVSTCDTAMAVRPVALGRLSAYLHHGHVSPFRIAYEARQLESDGAENFLDQLLWRELAYNFYFFTVNPPGIEASPCWAGAMQRAHAGAERRQSIDIESLARSRSGDPDWDLAQASLRIHGALHNDLSMAWGKASALRQHGVQSALDALTELNQRYALDGSDPSSCHGLLSTLGLFDRALHESPGVRTSQRHSRAACAFHSIPRSSHGRQVQPSSGRALRVAVIGAGIAGLTAARTLQDQGHRVSVFEKSRSVGGRAATRRVGDIGFDHGAQHFTADDVRFRRVVDAWRAGGLVEAWQGRVGRAAGGRVEASSEDTRERFVGVPGMSAIGKHLAAELSIHRGILVAPPRYSRAQWQLHSEGGEALGEFDALIVAAPAPQAQLLLAPAAPHLAQRAGEAIFAPAWALMLGLSAEPKWPCDGLFFDGGEVAWAARNNSKPGRSGHSWVIHAAADWTRSHLDISAEQAADQLTSAFATRTGGDLGEIVARSAHLWLYSLVENPLDVGALWDPDLRLAVCGDWCQSACIEGAFLSGQAAAGHLMRDLTQHRIETQWPAQIVRGVPAYRRTLALSKDTGIPVE
jgi:predicted NAD/FAD-dependent oxidoreductase/deoxyribodipyrimidine photolyase